MTVRILQVEDNPADVELLADALDELGGDTTIMTAADGAEAIAILTRTGAHAGAPRPDLVLLDLNLPVTSGHEVLAAIKSDAALRTLPVIVLTTSRSSEDVRTSYDRGANAYVCKPQGMKGVRELAAALRSFWLSCNVYADPP